MNFFSKITYKKRKKELLMLFPSSRIDSRCIYDDKTIIEGENVICANVQIQSSFVGYASVIGRNSVLSYSRIGRYCSIAENVTVQPYTHPIDFVSSYPGFFKTINNYPFGKGNTEFCEVLKTNNGFFCEIGNDVWIGQNVIIKGGIKVGDGAIIGMGAVVTKDVPPYAIVAGVPAKVIRFRFLNDKIASLLKIQWWNWDVNTIKNRRNEFNNIDDFVKKYSL